MRFLAEIVIVSTLFVLSQVAVSLAAIYHVKVTGSDSHTCTQAQNASTPKRTIKAALACLGTSEGAGAGHTVRVYVGTYTERLNNVMPGGTSWDKPFILESNPGDQVTLRPASGCTGHVVEIGRSSSKYIVLRSGNTTIPGVPGPRFTIDGVNCESPNDGIKISSVQGASTNVRLQDLEIKNAVHQGIQITDSASFNHLLRVWSHSNGVREAHDHGLYLKGSDNLIENSLFEKNKAQGINVRGSNSLRNVIRYNTMRFNGARGVSIYHDPIVHSNLLYGNVLGGLRFQSDANNAKILNNSIYKNDGPAVYFPSTFSGKVNVINNIFWQNKSDGITNPPSTVTAKNNLTIDPQFLDAGKFDLRLKSSSPAIDKGMGLAVVTNDFAGVPRPQGFAHDIGAYEYVPITSNPPSTPSALQVSVQ